MLTSLCRIWPRSTPRSTRWLPTRSVAPSGSPPSTRTRASEGAAGLLLKPVGGRCRCTGCGPCCGPAAPLLSAYGTVQDLRDTRVCMDRRRPSHHIDLSTVPWAVGMSTALGRPGLLWSVMRLSGCHGGSCCCPACQRLMYSAMLYWRSPQACIVTQDADKHSCQHVGAVNIHWGPYL